MINIGEKIKLTITYLNTYSRIKKIYIASHKYLCQNKCNFSFGSNNFSRLLYFYHFLLIIFIFFSSHPSLQIFYSLKKQSFRACYMRS